MHTTPTRNKKVKLVKVKEDGAKFNFVIPIVSGEKDLEFMINKQIPSYKDPVTSLEYTGPNKFHNFGQYCSGAFKAAWKNGLAQNFHKNALRINPAYDLELVGAWTRFY